MSHSSSRKPGDDSHEDHSGKLDEEQEFNLRDMVQQLREQRDQFTREWKVAMLNDEYERAAKLRAEEGLLTRRMIEIMGQKNFPRPKPSLWEAQELLVDMGIAIDIFSDILPRLTDIERRLHNLETLRFPAWATLKNVWRSWMSRPKSGRLKGVSTNWRSETETDLRRLICFAPCLETLSAR